MKTFIASSDFHLDCPIKIFENSELRRTELLETISRIFKDAQDEKVNYLFLTGDIFDNEFVEDRTLRFLKDKMEMIRDIKIFITPGNHDFIGKNSAWVDYPWPENVHVFGEYETIKIDGILISGVGFMSNNEENSLIPEDISINPFKRVNSIANSLIHILLLHGGPGLRGYNPIDITALKNYTHVIGGHIHNYKSNGNLTYSGAPYSRSFSESGIHGYIKGFIFDKDVKIEFRPIEGRRYETIEIDLNFGEEIKDNNDVIKLIEEEINTRNLNSDDVIRIFLGGFIEVGDVINEDYIVNKLSHYKNLQLNLSKLSFNNLNELMKEGTITKRYIEKLNYNKNNLVISNNDGNNSLENEEKVRDLALKIGLKALSGYQLK